ncbi:MAG: hypothetical protein H0V12_07230 [Chloroflexi bacterium]|nr:hypothetical protein [Chloroflexota bacterium]
MIDSLLVLVALAVVAGGGTILVDSLVVRTIRRIHAQQQSAKAASPEDGSTAE